MIFRIHLILSMSLIFLSADLSRAQILDSEPFTTLDVIELKGAPVNFARSFVDITDNGNIVVIHYTQGSFLIFDRDGNFLKKVGQKGHGPGEFEYLMDVEVLPSGNFLAADFSGRLSLFDENGNVLDSYQVEVMPLKSIHLLDEKSVLIQGLDRTNPDSKLLHILNLDTGKVEKSFLTLHSKWESMVVFYTVCLH